MPDNRERVRFSSTAAYYAGSILCLVLAASAYIALSQKNSQSLQFLIPGLLVIIAIVCLGGKNEIRINLRTGDVHVVSGVWPFLSERSDMLSDYASVDICSRSVVDNRTDSWPLIRTSRVVSRLGFLTKRGERIPIPVMVPQLLIEGKASEVADLTGLPLTRSGSKYDVTLGE